MSWFDTIYGRPGRGVDPNEPEKKGLARFAQMLGRDFGQLIATNFLVCILILPAALGVSLGVILLNFPFTLLAGILTGLLAGLGLLLMADCCLRSLCNDPSPWMYRAVQTIKSRWKAALPLGALILTLLGGLCFVWAFLFAVLDQGGQYPGGAVLAFLGFDMLVLAVGGSLAVAVLAAIPAEQARLGALFRGAGQMLLLSPGRSIAGSLVILAGVAVLIVFFPVSTFWAMLDARIGYLPQEIVLEDEDITVWDFLFEGREASFITGELIPVAGGFGLPTPIYGDFQGMQHQSQTK